MRFSLFCFQLLDLMHTLHTRAATIFSSWAEEQHLPDEPDALEDEDDTVRSPSHPSQPAPQPYMVGYESIDAGTSTLWSKCWCPLLQGQYEPLHNKHVFFLQMY